MKIEFKNGSTVESLESNTNRGKRADLPMWLDAYDYCLNCMTAEELNEILKPYTKVKCE